MKTMLEAKKANAKKRSQARAESAIKNYEDKQVEIKKLLRQISVAVDESDRNRTESVNWAHVADLNRIVRKLEDVKDQLKNTGEYGNFDRSGKSIKMTVPSD